MLSEHICEAHYPVKYNFIFHPGGSKINEKNQCVRFVSTVFGFLLKTILCPSCFTLLTERRFIPPTIGRL